VNLRDKENTLPVKQLVGFNSGTSGPQLNALSSEAMQSCNMCWLAML